MDVELHMEVIRIIGDDRVEAMHHFLGSRQISYVTTKRVLRNMRIEAALAKEEPMAEIAERFKVSLSTVKRCRDAMLGKK